MIYKISKRIFDFVCAFIGIIGTSPIWLISIILTEISDPGPLFYFCGKEQQTVQDVEIPFNAHCSWGK